MQKETKTFYMVLTSEARHVYITHSLDSYFEVGVWTPTGEFIESWRSPFSAGIEAAADTAKSRWPDLEVNEVSTEPHRVLVPIRIRTI